MTARRPPPRVRRGTIGLVAWIVGLLATGWVLDRLGSGALAAPPIGSRHELARWADRRDEAEIIMAVVRMVAVAMVAYLLALSVVGSLLRLAQVETTTFTDRLTPRWIVGLLDSSLGLGVTAALGFAAIAVPTGASAAPSAVHPVPSEPMIMTPVDDTEATAPAPAPVGTARSAGSAGRPASVADATPDGMPNGVADSMPNGAADSMSDGMADATPDSISSRLWTTETGDHLWAIAAETLADELGRHPTEAETASYWSELVARNRERLVDPTNPDLILPGQQFELPPISD